MTTSLSAPHLHRLPLHLTHRTCRISTMEYLEEFSALAVQKFAFYKANNNVRFQVLTTASMKMAVFWIVLSFSLVEDYDVSEVFAASIIRAMSEIVGHNRESGRKLKKIT
jgi:hypothetical protein